VVDVTFGYVVDFMFEHFMLFCNNWIVSVLNLMLCKLCCFLSFISCYIMNACLCHLEAILSVKCMSQPK
jgi:hypothetical protein